MKEILGIFPWEMKPFLEVLEIRAGTINPRSYPDELFELFSIPAFDSGIGAEKTNGRAIGSSKTIVSPGDCLYSKLNPRIPRTWVAPNSSDGHRQICSTEFWPIRSKYNEGHPYYLVPHFLKWLFRFEGFLDRFRGNISGGVQSRQRLKREDLVSVEIPIPPLDEQHRIVARIEELTRRTEEVRRLSMAATQEISHIFQIEIDRIFLPQETDDWDEYESTYIFDIVRGQVEPMDPPYRDLPHVAPDCIESGTGRLLLNRVKTPRELRLASGKYHFKADHVLYSKIRPNLRKVALPSFEGTCSADMYSLIPNIELVTREFLALALLSPPFTQYAVENSDRNAMPKINRPKLFAYKMKLPGKKIQEEITARIKEIQDMAEEIHALQVQNERDMAKFQSALLAKAFRGEL